MLSRSIVELIDKSDELSYVHWLDRPVGRDAHFKINVGMREDMMTAPLISHFEPVVSHPFEFLGPAVIDYDTTYSSISQAVDRGGEKRSHRIHYK
jgi:hypothetical protein